MIGDRQRRSRPLRPAAQEVRSVTLEQAIAIAIVVGMMILFVWGKVRFDLTALLALLAAIASGIVPIEKAFSGFGDQVVVIVGAALILSAGVGKSGIIGRLVRAMESRLKTTGARVFMLSAAVAASSSFIKNIAALAIFLPIALQISRRSGIFTPLVPT